MQPPPLDADSRDALTYRAAIQQALPDDICACCGQHVDRPEIASYSWEQVEPMLQPIFYDPATADAAVHRPQHCTIWAPPASASGAAGSSGTTMYHLQGDEEAGCIRVDAMGSIEVDICRACSKDLALGRKPLLSYARVDNGPRPAELPQLTLLEERAVSPARVLRHLMICRHVAQRGPDDPTLFHSKLRAHIISFNGPEPREIAALFPVKPSDLPEAGQRGAIQGSRRQRHPHLGSAE